MSRFDDANAALESRDWTGAQPDDKAGPPTVVHSVRMSRQLTERLFAEAKHRGVTPSEVIRDLVEGGLSVLDESATVRVADVLRAIDALAAPRAAS